MKLKKFITIAIILIICLYTVSISATADDIERLDEKYNVNDAIETSTRKENLNLIYSTIQGVDFWQFISIYINDKECHKHSNTDMFDACLTDLFQIPQVTEDYQALYNDSIWHSFLKRDNEVLSIIDFVISDGEVFYTISEKYVNKINSIKSEKLNMYFYDNSFCCNDSRIEKSIINTVKEININKLRLISKSVLQSLNDMNITDSLKTVVNIPYGKELENYPVFYQGATNLCWACTIASMVKYEFPVTYSTIGYGNVCNTIGCHTGATWDQITLALNYYFDYPYIVGSVESYFTKAQIMETIGNDDPALMSSLDASGSNAHITALIGYREIGSLMAIKIMNPGTGQLEWGYYSTNSPFAYSYNGGAYTWDKSIRLYYS